MLLLTVLPLLLPEVSAPAPLLPVPTPAQLRWQRMERYAFVHFGPNTFTDREWGEGNEDPKNFAPSALDAGQWARALKESGFGGLILTAKHHDGFCLWPSRHTTHDIAASPWRDGKGDLVQEVSQACREAGIAFGVYLSPWDRHEPSYGDSPRYNEHYVAQLTELLSGYGPLFEVWWDGACGEGPNGKRQEYDWPRFRKLVRELQPQAVIFSDVGPDVRWVGNERGFAGETCWSMQSPGDRTPGIGAPPTSELNEGLRDGVQWIPAECDVSIRPGWFHHTREDERVKSVAELLEIYYASVGRNGNLLLNIPADRRGLFHENDVARLKEFDAALKQIFAHDLIRAAQSSLLVTASGMRGNVARFGPLQLFDGDPSTYWALDDGQKTGHVTLSFEEPVRADQLVLCEPIELGQRVARFRVEVEQSGVWKELVRGTTIGAKRILRFAPQEIAALRVHIEDARGTLLLSSLELYLAPDSVYPLVHGSGNGAPLPALQLLRAPDPGLRVRAFEVQLEKLAGASALAADAHVAESVVTRIDLAPLTRAEQAALIFDGYLEVPKTGRFQFTLASDDGSRLFLDEVLVIDNDGLHGAEPRQGSIALEQGWHRVRLEYFQAGGAKQLALRWAGPGLGLFGAEIAPERLFH